MTEPILSVKNISKFYDGYQALTDVSLDVYQGRIFGLLGPNGAGKTTLIRLINQITYPENGAIYLNGEPLSPTDVDTIGYLPEERGLYKKMKVGEQSLYLAQLKGLSKKEAEFELKKWFEKFEITGWWNKKIEELSKGMAQKIQFITTVIHKPKLLILDEPFSGFDPINANLIKKELLEMRDNGVSIILSTHNMESVEEICDDIALIYKSKNILSGKINDIKTEFSKTEFSIEFKGNMIAFTNALWAGFELLNHTSINNNHHIANVKMLNDNGVNSLLTEILPHVTIIGVKEIKPSMNDIFIQQVENYQS